MEFSRPEHWSEGISPTQGLNPGLPRCRWIRYQLSDQESPLSPVNICKPNTFSASASWRSQSATRLTLTGENHPSVSLRSQLRKCRAGWVLTAILSYCKSDGRGLELLSRVPSSHALWSSTINPFCALQRQQPAHQCI